MTTGSPASFHTPAITMGSDFDIVTLNMARYERFIFHCSAMGEHHILVEVCIKLREDALPEGHKETHEHRCHEIQTAGYHFHCRGYLDRDV